MSTSFFSMKTFLTTIFVSGLTIFTAQAQKVELSGKIISNSELEGIHVINKSSYRYTTTDKNGLFSIEVKVSDSLYFSSIQYLPKIVIISANQIQ